jgi:hypothetical protein
MAKLESHRFRHSCFDIPSSLVIRLPHRGAAKAGASSSMKVLFRTNEYPPHIYGGAGVHVGYLSCELAKAMAVEVRVTCKEPAR